MAIFAGTRIQAQPESADKLRTEIALVAKQIVKHPSDPVLREKRGDLYVGLYRILFSHGDSQASRMDKIDLVSKGIADYSHIVWTEHGPAEIFLKRGTAYALRWRLATANWAEATRGNRDPKWNDLVDWEDRALERAVFRKFTTNPDFDRAAADLERARRERNDPAVEIEAELTMAKLYLERPRIIPYAKSAFARKLAEGSVVDDGIWQDYDDAIRNFAYYEGPQMPGTKPLHMVLFPHGFGESTSQTALYERMLLAIAFGRDAEAMAFRSRYLAWVSTVPLGNELSCKYFATAYQSEVRLGKYDYVIDYFGMGLAKDPQLECAPAHEPLADAYFAKGEYERAVAEYTVAKGPSRVDLKRAKAFLKLGQREKALVDLAAFLDKDADGSALPEAHLLRASVLREMGDREMAMRDEIAARNLKIANDNEKLTGLIYGTVLMPDGRPASEAQAAFVTINYADGSIERSYVDAKGRFAVFHLKPQPFYLTASADEKFRGRTRPFPTLRSHVGPLQIRATAAKE